MRRLLPILIVLICSATPCFAQDVQGIEFFEKKIRPILSEHCYSCHSATAKKLRAGLLLDTKAGLLRGGDTGPGLVVGDPAKSLILQAIRHQDELKMPPKSRLPDSVVADFETWIKLGAPDPRLGDASAKIKSPSVEAGRAFWSYQPVHKPTLPTVKDPSWGRDPIDAFILAKIEAEGARPAFDALPHVLVRRLYFDLIGLPPTPEEISAFEVVASKDMDRAVMETIDRLLSSPQFGERWGRHWLDVARYAESLTLRGFVFKEAWRYRDYVVDAFNDDLPFDRFIREQIAGDLLPAANPDEKRRQLTGAGFLTLGNNNLEEQDKEQLRMDVVDEQIETLGRAFLGQTIGCARCHDHKFDPIPTHDYYALAGILRSTKTLDTSTNVAKWLEMPLPEPPNRQEILRKHDKIVSEKQKEIDTLKAEMKKDAATTKSTMVRAGKSIAIASLPGIVVDNSQAMKVGVWTSSTSNAPFIGDDYLHDGNQGQGDKTLTFQAQLPHSGKYEVRFAYQPGDNRTTSASVTVFSEEGEKTILINQKQKPAIEGLLVSLGQFRFEKTGQCYVMVSNEGANGYVIADAVLFIPVEQLVDAKSPSKDLGDKLRVMEVQMTKLLDSGPSRAMVMGIEEEKAISNVRIHVRGSVHNLGAVVPRGFLQVATLGAVALPPTKESGRRELAHWIASPDHPLTARVMANRIWSWMIGTGIVRTVDQFGSTGERPSHPELLDHLANRFVTEGWSMKKLVRAIALSRTYRQASGPSLPSDPENRLFAHANRRRMDAECIRDAILSTSGQLNLVRGGPLFPSKLASDYNYKHTDLRRSIYAPVFRNALPEIFEVFDFADPSVSIGQRASSTVAQQALFMMNNPFVLQQAKSMAQKLLALKDLDEAGRIERAYRLTLGRTPRAVEVQLAQGFLNRGESREQAELWARFIQNLYASLEFRYVP